MVNHGYPKSIYAESGGSFLTGTPCSFKDAQYQLLLIEIVAMTMSYDLMSLIIRPNHYRLWCAGQSIALNYVDLA